MWHPGIPENYRNEVVCGDARVLAQRLPDESVDLVLTDPPYHDEFLWSWEWLSVLGARVLKPGGLVAAYSGKHALDAVMAGLSSNLTYFWTIAGVQMNSNDRFWSRRILGAWRPIVLYSKGEPETPWLVDARATNRDKRFHAWGQGHGLFAYYLERLTQPGAVVLDPFCGGGTVPAVCKSSGRNWIGFEIDPTTATLARERIRTTPFPLLVVEPEETQMEMTL